MKSNSLTAAELKIMNVFWDRGPASIREILDEYADERRRPAYTTVQTLIYRLEEKGAVRRARKIGGAHIFEPVISRNTAQRKMFDELLDLFGGRAQPLVSHLVESGKLTHEDIEAAKRQLRGKRKAKSTPSTKDTKGKTRG